MSSVYDSADWRALVAAVRADPDNDLFRLTCADWLDDRGEADRAELIRLQVVMAEPNICPGECGHSDYDRWCNVDVPTDCLACQLWRQVYAVASRPDARYRATLPDDFRVWLEHGWWHYPDDGDRSHPEVMLTRGFAEEFRGPADLWVRHADALLAREPVRRVVLTTQPAALETADGYYCRFADDPSLTGFTRAECWAATTDAEARPLLGLLRLRWPGVEFELPPAELTAAGLNATAVPLGVRRGEFTDRLGDVRVTATAAGVGFRLGDLDTEEGE